MAKYIDSIEANTLVDVLRWRATHQAKQLAYCFLTDGEVESARWTYADLDERARAVAASLQAQGLSGQPVLLLYPPGLDYIAAFFGCLYAGAIAVPSYPPRNNRSLDRLASIVQDAGATVALTVNRIAEQFAHTAHTAADQLTPLQGLRWQATDTPDLLTSATAWQPMHINDTTLAFLQYTSGSTSSPKGVMVSHRNLMVNEKMMHHGFGYKPDDFMVSWLPIYHDMGLIMVVLATMYSGIPCIKMSPAAFLQKPLRWLQAISRYRATASGAPDFAYKLCAQKVTPAQLAELDLSTWTMAFNGSEPVRADTLNLFAETFAQCGFRRATFYPVYGLAEATVYVSGGVRSEVPASCAVHGAILTGGQVRTVEAHENADARVLISCGTAQGDEQIVIVDPETQQLSPPDKVGEVWVTGDHIAHGYWKRAEATEETFQGYLAQPTIAGVNPGPYLRTGDLGFLRDGELFIAGRLKDLVIIRGRNHYPQDLELTAEQSHSALRIGCGAAFTVDDGTAEQLVIVYEVERTALRRIDTAEVARAVRRAIAEYHGVQLATLVLIRTGTIKKTSSGKIQRRACREAYLAGTLEAIGEDTIGQEAAFETGQRQVKIDRNEVTALPPDEQAHIIMEYLRSALAAALRLPTIDLNPDDPLSLFGMDSLTIVEIKQQIEGDLLVDLGELRSLVGMTTSELVEIIRTNMLIDNKPSGEDIDQTDGLSDDDVEALLRQMLPD